MPTSRFRFAWVYSANPAPRYVDGGQTPTIADGEIRQMDCRSLVQRQQVQIKACINVWPVAASAANLQQNLS
jgi:hypothetical protein